MEKKCYACGRGFTADENRVLVDTHEDQAVFVGRECYRHIVASGENGWQPPKGGPRLWTMTLNRSKYFDHLRVQAGMKAVKSQ